jgi:hypothetical protein
MNYVKVFLNYYTINDFVESEKAIILQVLQLQDGRFLVLYTIDRTREM